jgi:hypothetical protein
MIPGVLAPNIRVRLSEKRIRGSGFCSCQNKQSGICVSFNPKLVSYLHGYVPRAKIRFIVQVLNRGCLFRHSFEVRRFETELSAARFNKFAVMGKDDEETRKTIQAYNKLLNSRSTFKYSSKAARDPEEALRRLANLILVNGIPAKAVRVWKLTFGIGT